jgi:hypothetical protein
MRIRNRYIKWDKEPYLIKEIINILENFSIKYSYKEDPDCIIPTFCYEIIFYLYEDLPFINDIKKRLQKFELMPIVTTEYDKKDMDNAEWFIISTGQYQYPQPDDDCWDYLKYTFNTDNHCMLCGIGKIQNAPYRLKQPKQKNNQFWGLYWVSDAIFVREETKIILEKEQLQKIHFSQPVLHKNNRPIERFYQLHIDTLLDKGYNAHNADMEICNSDDSEHNLKCCGRIKYDYPKGWFVFDKKIFSKEIDFCTSNEYFGSGGQAERLNIVSKRVKEIIERNQLKGVIFKPIMYQ